jgi:hypothetical protein
MLLHNNGPRDPHSLEVRLPRANGRVEFHSGLWSIEEVIPIADLPGPTVQIKAYRHGSSFVPLSLLP